MTCIKIALKREPGYPVGQTAPLTMTCVCGRTIWVPPGIEQLLCPGCERVWSASGWLLDGTGR